MDIFGGVQFIVQCKTPSTFKSDQIKKIIGGSRSRTWQSNVFRNCMLFLGSGICSAFSSMAPCQISIAGEWPVNPEVHAIPLILKRISSFNGAICFDARKKETVGTSPTSHCIPWLSQCSHRLQVQLRIQLSPSVHLHLGCEVKNAPHSTKILLYI